MSSATATFKTITDPFEQGRKSKHHLKNQIIRKVVKRGKAFRSQSGHAVIFPDCEYRDQPRQLWI